MPSCAQDFVQEYEKANRPVIITGAPPRYAHAPPHPMPCHARTLDAGV